MTGYVTIASEVCKGCGLCIEFCPKKALACDEETLNSKGYHPAHAKEGQNCIGCAMCAILCPDSAIKVEREDGANG